MAGTAVTFGPTGLPLIAAIGIASATRVYLV
jgi:hypothetical protein